MGDIVGYGSGDEDLFRGADVRGEAAPPLSVEFRENVVEEEDVFFADPSGVRPARQLTLTMPLGTIPEVQWHMRRERR